MTTPQPGILAPVPRLARYLTFRLRHGADPRPTLANVVGRAADGSAVLGLGRSLELALGRADEAARTFPAHVGAGFEVPSTPAALWVWLRGEDRGDLVHASRALCADLESAFEATQVIDAFQHGASRDLTGYEDGTENPTGDAAAAAGIAADGSSYVAVQQWVHDLAHFNAHSQERRDHIIGRRLSDNEELDDAPASAHVKRTAQEDFDPEAFVLRRSMPWADAEREGLVFVAFGRSYDAFEAQLRRMVGQDDGVVDALFDFTRPLTGAFFRCPPLVNGQLALTDTP
jgi:putative iron-dependent peroxidase